MWGGGEGRNKANVVFLNALNTFYLRLYGENPWPIFLHS